MVHCCHIPYYPKAKFSILKIFVLTIISLLFIKNRISIFVVALILGYLTTSVVSNGFALRPLASYLFFLICAVILTNENTEKGYD